MSTGSYLPRDWRGDFQSVVDLGASRSVTNFHVQEAAACAVRDEMIRTFGYGAGTGPVYETFTVQVDQNGVISGFGLKPPVNQKEGADNLDAAWGHPRRAYAHERAYARAYLSDFYRQQAAINQGEQHGKS